MLHHEKSPQEHAAAKKPARATVVTHREPDSPAGKSEASCPSIDTAARPSAHTDVVVQVVYPDGSPHAGIPIRFWVDDPMHPSTSTESIADANGIARASVAAIRAKRTALNQITATAVVHGTPGIEASVRGRIGLLVLRVVDPKGRPVVGATVCGTRWQILARKTGSHGEVTFPASETPGREAGRRRDRGGLDYAEGTESTERFPRPRCSSSRSG